MNNSQLHNMRGSMNSSSPQLQQQAINPNSMIRMDSGHSACMDRIKIMAQELDRMSDALQLKNQECLKLNRQLESVQVNPQQEDEIDRLNKLLFDATIQNESLKNNLISEIKTKDDEIAQLRYDLKATKLEKMEYVNRYSEKCEETMRLQRQLEAQRNDKLGVQLFVEHENKVDRISDTKQSRSYTTQVVQPRESVYSQNGRQVQDIIYREPTQTRRIEPQQQSQSSPYRYTPNVNVSYSKQQHNDSREYTTVERQRITTNTRRDSQYDNTNQEQRKVMQLIGNPDQNYNTIQYEHVEDRQKWSSQEPKTYVKKNITEYRSQVVNQNYQQ